MATVVQNVTATTYLNSLDVPITVSAITQLQNFQFTQKLTYAGILSQLAKNFHGLQDWYDQMTIYSATNPILTNAWNTIKPFAKQNLDLQPQMYIDPVLGQVGITFLQIPAFSAIFTVTPSDTSQSISSKVQSSS
jgi:hypothetical protein